MNIPPQKYFLLSKPKHGQEHKNQKTECLDHQTELVYKKKYL